MATDQGDTVAVNPGLDDSAGDDERGGLINVQQGRQASTGWKDDGPAGDGSRNPINNGGTTGRPDGMDPDDAADAYGQRVYDEGRRISTGYTFRSQDNPTVRTDPSRPEIFAQPGDDIEGRRRSTGYVHDSNAGNQSHSSGNPDFLGDGVMDPTDPESDIRDGRTIPGGGGA
jgi:hypothetical protein